MMQDLWEVYTSYPLALRILVGLSLYLTVGLAAAALHIRAALTHQYKIVKQRVTDLELSKIVDMGLAVCFVWPLAVPLDVIFALSVALHESLGGLAKRTREEFDAAYNTVETPKPRIYVPAQKPNDSFRAFIENRPEIELDYAYFLDKYRGNADAAHHFYRIYLRERERR